MAIDSQGRWGPNVADAVDTWADANVPQDSFIDDEKLREFWRVVTGQHQLELNDHQDIVLQAGDIPVDPGTFEDTDSHSAIIGVGISEAVTLQQRTK